MTDERAIEVLNIMKSQMNYFGATVRYGGVKEMQEQAVDCALKALSEIQQYRSIGAVEECKAYREACEVLHLEQLSEYRELGTVEECRAAAEKQSAKKIIFNSEDDREYEDYICPNCKDILQQRRKGATRITIFKFRFCHGCGQKLDWSDTP